ncbi:MAG: GH25 family lysozyme [Candidatus Fimenecus sp.]
MSKKGVDLSKHNGSVDFKTLKNAGIDFVILRAGYGNTSKQKDIRFEENYAKAKAAGLPVGTYWYSYADSVEEVGREAEAFYECIKGKTFEYPVYFDIEEAKQIKRGMEFCSSLVKAFCEKMEQKGYYAGFYTSKAHLLNVISRDVRYRFTVWVAQWADKLTYTDPYGLWQYTSDGSVPGVNGRVDMNLCDMDFPTIIKANGLNGFTKTAAPTPQPNRKSVDEIANEVISGKWGNGEERKKRLSQAGYDYNAVQNRVNALVAAPKRKSIDEIAREVIQGKWGNGLTRKVKLKKAGYDPAEVQKRVNQLL